MLENVALARWAPGKTIVIVAGNSILNGYGQAERDVWTLRLQEELGDRYVVVNLAFRGALPYEAGALVAESLLRRNYPVVLVSNTSPGTVGRVAGNAYGYLYYDALYKGRLFNHPARDANIAEWEATATPAVRAEQDELRRAARLDANLRFQALWHHVGYRHLFTTWNPHTRPQFWQARASAVDNLPVAPPLAERFRTEVASELTITQGFSVNLAEPDGSGSWRVLGPPAEIVSDLIEDMIPPKMRRHMVMLLTQNAPFYRTRLTPTELARDNLVFSAYEQQWRKHGIAAHIVGLDFTDEDYYDRSHLAAAGGRKLARLTADYVRQISPP